MRERERERESTAVEKRKLLQPWMMDFEVRTKDMA